MYRPLVWTADGRPHPAVTRTLAIAAEMAATRSEQHADGRSLQARWRHEIMIALLRRRAAMARAVLPRRNARETWLLTGHTCSVPGSEQRAAPLDEGGPAAAANDAADEARGIEESEGEGGGAAGDAHSEA